MFPNLVMFPGVGMILVINSYLLTYSNSTLTNLVSLDFAENLLGSQRGLVQGKFCSNLNETFKVGGKKEGTLKAEFY